MSGNGMISSVGGSPITGLGESLRSADRLTQAGPAAHENIREVMGVVDGVNPDLARWITAHEANGKTLFKGQWIELNHSAREIAERWGTVPIGAMIRVTIYGPGDGVSASATIIDAEGKGADEPHYANEAEQGLYAVFAPGSSLT